MSKFPNISKKCNKLTVIFVSITKTTDPTIALASYLIDRHNVSYVSSPDEQIILIEKYWRIVIFNVQDRGHPACLRIRPKRIPQPSGMHAE